MGKPVADMTAIEQWTVFLAKASDPRCRDAINEILKRKEGISVAYEMLTSISTDENERARFRSRRMWQMDRDHEIAQALFEGEERAKLQFEQAKAQFEQAKAQFEQSLADKDAVIAELHAKLDGRA